MIINIGTILFFPFVEKAFDFWVNFKIEFNHYLFSLLIINSLVIAYGSIFLYFLKSINKVKLILKATVIKTIILYSLIFILEKTLENIGLSLLISNTVIYIFYLNIHIFNLKLHSNFSSYLKNIFISLIPFAVTIVYIIFWENLKGILYTFIFLFSLIFIYIFYQKNISTFSYDY